MVLHQPDQLKQRGVFEFMTVAELRRRGCSKPIHIQCLVVENVVGLAVQLNAEVCVNTYSSLLDSSLLSK